METLELSGATPETLINTETHFLPNLRCITSKGCEKRVEWVHRQGMHLSPDPPPALKRPPDPRRTDAKADFTQDFIQTPRAATPRFLNELLPLHD